MPRELRWSAVSDHLCVPFRYIFFLHNRRDDHKFCEFTPNDLSLNQSNYDDIPLQPSVIYFTDAAAHLHYVSRTKGVHVAAMLRIHVKTAELKLLQKLSKKNPSIIHNIFPDQRRLTPLVAPTVGMCQVSFVCEWTLSHTKYLLAIITVKFQF